MTCKPAIKDLRAVFTFVSLLKACAKKKDTSTGRRLHAAIVKKGLLEKSPHLNCSLISMYVKCGLIPQGKQLLQGLSAQNVACWSALISGYVQQGHGREALNCFERMQRDGICPDAITFTCLLKACGMEGDLEKGKQIHMEIVSTCLLDDDIMLGNVLVDMYVKCGVLAQAHQALEELSTRNVVSWNTLIAGYVKQVQCHEKALETFKQMQMEGVTPNNVTFICILKACHNLGLIDKSIQIHNEIVKRGLLEKDIVLGNALVDMYAKCGMLAEAHQVLEELPVHDVITWSALMSGYACQGQCYEVLHCFEQMQIEGIGPNTATFVCVLYACGSMENLTKGRQIHEMIIAKDMMEKEITLGNALLDMYAKCGVVEKSQEVLEGLLVRDIISWNALIAGYAAQGQRCKALDCLQEMEKEGLPPNAITFISISKACGHTGALNEGKKIHRKIIISGLLDKDMALGNALIDMYAKCGTPIKAQEVLEKLQVRTTASWNALISGYTQVGRFQEALNCYERMQNEGLSPNVVTLTSILKACHSLGATDKAKLILNKTVGRTLLENEDYDNSTSANVYAKDHKSNSMQQIIENPRAQSVASPPPGHSQHGQSYETNPYLTCTLISMYAKSGLITKAQQLLEDLPVRCIDTWNALLSGYTYQGQCYEALDCFEWMETEGLIANAITLSCVLKACGNGGAIHKGKQIHETVLKRGLLDKDIVLGNGLVDMYAKCGMLSKAQEVLEELPLRNAVTWSSLISGYAQQRQGHKALRCFQMMLSEGLSPDEVTLLCVLSACSHSGFVDEAKVIFENMIWKYGMPPNTEHHTCMMMALGYAGHFEEAMSTIKVMPSCNESAAVSLALLVACRKWVNMKFGNMAFAMR